MNNGKAVIVKELIKRFDHFTAVDGISFEVERGAVYGILGPNGAGKSTTMRMLCGIIEPSGGHGTVGGYDIAKESEQIKSHIGYMSQKFSLYEDLTVEENIDFYNGIYHVPPSKRRERKDFVITMAGLQKHVKMKTASLPTGWKQRLALGCAILHEPSIIFLDEPTAGVDPMSRRNFWKLIYDLSDKGVTIIVTTHYVEEAEYFDHIALIYRGKVIANGAPAELKSKEMKEKVFEVVCENPRAVLLEIPDLPAVKEVGLYGKGLHIVTDELETAQASIKALLTQRNIKLVRMGEIAPTMEDLFISLIEAHDKKGNGVR